MSSDQNLDIARSWLRAFNKKDLPRLLALYAENAEHYSPKLKAAKPETHGLICGKDALRSWWQDAFERLPTLHYEVVALTADEDRVFMEYLRKVAGEADLRVAEVLETRGGVIIASRVYHGS